MVCCDKTGILTINQMGVENLWVYDEAYSASEFLHTNESSAHGHIISHHSHHPSSNNSSSNNTSGKNDPTQLTTQVGRKVLYYILLFCCHFPSHSPHLESQYTYDTIL